jgi:hypothetical protein
VRAEEPGLIAQRSSRGGGGRAARVWLIEHRCLP